MKKLLVIVFVMSSVYVFSQQKFEFDGQLSGVTSFSPANELDAFAGIRYIPEISYQLGSDTTQIFDVEVSANINASALFHPFAKSEEQLNVSPYRAWLRYKNKQFEVRAGLQKIDFGVAMLLRPLQWFNQIDPRDRLQLTNGVYAVLGRYYFLNNANIWLWGLYGNKLQRGLDTAPTASETPEYGGRFQHPAGKGELAISYHHRIADPNQISPAPVAVGTVPENRFAIDGKWDVGVGIWFETSYIRKSAEVENLTNQSLLNIGTDYTFGVGNGLGITFEHLFFSFNEKAFVFNQNFNVSAINLNYPLSFYDRLSVVTSVTWEAKQAAFFVNYEHQFKKATGYVMAFYNPENQIGLQGNDLTNSFAGPGIRLMFVYSH